MNNTLVIDKLKSKRYPIAFNIGIVLLGTMLLAMLSKITVFLPFTPVPVTGQTFGVILIAMLFGAKRSVITMLTYIAEGLAGLPVFAGSTLGIARIVGPTGGYILGFVVAAYVVGFLADKGWTKSFFKVFIASAIGSIVIYVFGVARLNMFLGFEKAIVSGVVPFIIGDLVKIFMITIIMKSLWLVQKDN